MIEQIYQLYGYLHGMWRYRWSALVVAWSIALIGLVVVLKMPSVYEAKAVFHLDTKSIMTPLLKGLAVENEESTADSQVMTRILLSRENMLNVIRENDMDLGVNSQAELDKLAAQLAEQIKITGGARRNGKFPRIFTRSAFRVIPPNVFTGLSRHYSILLSKTP